MWARKSRRRRRLVLRCGTCVHACMRASFEKFVLYGESACALLFSALPCLAPRVAGPFVNVSMSASVEMTTVPAAVSAGGAGPSSSSSSSLETMIEELLSKVLGEIDERDFSADDFVLIVDRAQQLVLTQHGTLTPLQQKNLVLKILRRLADFIMPKIQNEAVRAAIQVMLLSSGTLFDVLRQAFLKKFDLDNNGEVSVEEFNAVCKGCCCAPQAK